MQAHEEEERRLVPFPFRWMADAGPHTRGASTRPPPGCCQSFTCYKDKYLLLFGGGSLSRFSNAIHVYNIDAHTWSFREAENSSIVAPRLGHSAVVYKDTMLIYGGQDLKSPVVYNDVLQLDLSTWRWSLLQRAPPSPEGPGARRLHVAQVVGDVMYVLMGTATPSDDAFVWALDLRTGVWRDMSPTTVDGRRIRLHCTGTAESRASSDTSSDCVQPLLCGCASAVSDASIFLYGGYLAVEEELFHYGTLTYVPSLYEYNTRANTWRAIQLSENSPSPPVRYAASMAVHQGHVFIYGGDANQKELAWYFDDVWRLRLPRHGDAGRPAWEPLAVGGRAPSARSGCAYAYARSSLFIMGGELSSLRLLCSEPYTNELYALPLGYSSHLSLRECAARWLSLRPSPSVLFVLHTMPVRGLQLPLGARLALEPYVSS